MYADDPFNCLAYHFEDKDFTPSTCALVHTRTHVCTSTYIFICPNQHVRRQSHLITSQSTKRWDRQGGDKQLCMNKEGSSERGKPWLWWLPLLPCNLLFTPQWRGLSALAYWAFLSKSHCQWNGNLCVCSLLATNVGRDELGLRDARVLGDCCERICYKCLHEYLRIIYWFQRDYYAIFLAINIF